MIALHMQYTQVFDLSPLRDCTQLTTLDIGGTMVTDLQPLAESFKLTKVWRANHNAPYSEHSITMPIVISSFTSKLNDFKCTL